MKGEARDQLPDRNVALGRLFRGVKDLVAIIGKDSEHFPGIQTNLQVIIDCIKKCTEYGVFLTESKFLIATCQFVATLRALAESAKAALSKNIDPNDSINTDAREKLQALDNSVVIFSVYVPTLANLSVLAPEDERKLDHMLHYIASFLFVIVDALK